MCAVRASGPIVVVFFHARILTARKPRLLKIPDSDAGDADALLAQDRGDLIPARHALFTRVDVHHVRVHLVVVDLPRGGLHGDEPALGQGPGDFQFAPHPVEGERGLLRQDERKIVVHRCFAAKKALTFPRNSISLSSSAFSACKALYLAHSTGPSSAAPPAASGCASFQTRTQLLSVPSTTPISGAT